MYYCCYEMENSIALPKIFISLIPNDSFCAISVFSMEYSFEIDHQMRCPKIRCLCNKEFKLFYFSS